MLIFDDFNENGYPDILQSLARSNIIAIYYNRFTSAPEEIYDSNIGKSIVSSTLTHICTSPCFPCQEKQRLVTDAKRHNHGRSRQYSVL